MSTGTRVQTKRGALGTILYHNWVTETGENVYRVLLDSRRHGPNGANYKESELKEIK